MDDDKRTKRDKRLETDDDVKTMKADEEFATSVDESTTMKQGKELQIQKDERTLTNADEGLETVDERTAMKADEGVDDEGELSADPPDHPVDSGWAWVIMVANFVIVFLMLGYGRALSMFLMEFIDMFQVSVTATTVAFGLMTASFGIGNLVVSHALLPRLGTRKVVLMGAIFYSSAVAVTSFAPNMTFVTVTHCCIGFSHAMLYIPSLTLLGYYFNKRRSFAMAVSNTGVSVSALVFPPLTQALITHFGARGALLLMSGISLQCVVAASLLRPVSFYSKTASKKQQRHKQSAMNAGSVNGVKETGSVGHRNNVKLINHDAKPTSKDEDSKNGALQQLLRDSDSGAETSRKDKTCLVLHANSLTEKSHAKNGQESDLNTAHHNISSDHKPNEKDDAKPASDIPMPLKNMDMVQDSTNHLTENDAVHFMSRSMPERSYLYTSISVDDDVRQNEPAECKSHGDWTKNVERRNETVGLKNANGEAVRTNGEDNSRKDSRSEKDRSGTASHQSELQRLKEQARARYRTRTYSCPSDGPRLESRLDSSHSSDVYGPRSSHMSTSMRILHNAFSTSVVDVYGGSGAPNVASLWSVEEITMRDEDESQKRCCVFRCLSSIFDLTLFRNWLFRLILCYVPLGMSAGFIGFYFPSLGVSSGLSRPDAALLLTVVGSVDLCSRLAIGYLADLQLLKRTHLVVVCLFIVGMASHFTRFYTNFGLLATYAVIYGLNGGVCQNLLAVVIIDLLGLEYLGKAMGLVLLINASNAALTHVIIGALADASSGSFAASYSYIGGCLLLSAFILLLEPLARRLENRRIGRLRNGASDAPKV